MTASSKRAGERERGDVHAVIETKAGTDREELLDVLEEIAASYETVDEIARRGR